MLMFIKIDTLLESNTDACKMQLSILQYVNTT